MAVALGGRVAEELIYGPDNVTTGASGDFQQVTRALRLPQPRAPPLAAAVSRLPAAAAAAAACCCCCVPSVVPAAGASPVPACPLLCPLCRCPAWHA